MTPVKVIKGGSVGHKNVLFRRLNNIEQCTFSFNQNDLSKFIHNFKKKYFYIW